MLANSTTLSELLERKLMSVRSSNICLRYRLNNLGELCDFYRKHKDFSRFKNLGVKSNNELINLCEAHIVNNCESHIFNNTVESVEIKNEYNDIRQLEKLYILYASLNPIEKKITEDFYITFRDRLSVRAFNAIQKLSFDQTFNSSLESLHSINFNLHKIQNVGAKTINEIEIFFREFL